MINYPLIEICIDQVEKNYNKVFSDYQELSEVIAKDLNETFSKEELLDYYENYYCCEQQEAKILYKNIIQ